MRLITSTAQHLRLEEMIDLNEMLPQSTPHDLPVIAHRRPPTDAQRHVVVVSIHDVAHVFVCDILLREWKIFRLASYQEIACEIHLKHVGGQVVDGFDAKR